MTPRQHKLIYASSYDRGLIYLLKMWSKIKETYPDAELHIFYGWELFLKGFADNPERLAWKERMDQSMQQDGITHHGRVSKEELKKWEQECGIWAYPTDFGETNCITALDCQAQGCVPCVIEKAALADTVQSGIKVKGDIYDDETQEEYLKQLIALMGDEKKWLEEQKKGIKFAKQFTWAEIAKQWEKHFHDQA